MGRDEDLARLDAEIAEAAILSGLPENRGQVRMIRVHTGDGCVVIALFKEGRCLAVALDESKKKENPNG